MASTTTTSTGAGAGAGNGGAGSAGNVQRTKLTGWAQAAARSLPKQTQQALQQQQQQQQLHKSRSNTASPTSAVNKAPSPSNSALTNSPASNNNENNTRNSKRKSTKQPYNRDEVRAYMKSLFEQYSSTVSSQSTYHKMMHNNRKGQSLDWGTVTNSKSKNRKYGCLNEVAQSLWN